jgi:hypothetical protein
MPMNFNKIITELCWRLEDGTPDFSNPEHLQELRVVLTMHKWDAPAINELIETLTEEQLYVNNAENRRRGRVGKKWGSSPGDAPKKTKDKPEDGKAEKEPTKKIPQVITPKQSKKEQKKNEMLTEVAGLIVQTDPNKKSGPGTHTLNKEDVEIYTTFLDKTPEQQNEIVEKNKKDREEKYGPISEEDVDKTIEILREQLGPEFGTLKGKIRGKGDPPSNFKTGKAGAERFRNVIRHYLETGGISPITGEVVPFSSSQLDHIISLDNGGEDRPENWMWMEARFNQFKGSKTDPEIKAGLEELGYKTDTEWLLSASEKELAAFQKDESELFWKNQFEKNGKTTGLNESTLNNLDANEVNSLLKSWNNSLGKTDAERGKHPDFISRYPSKKVTLTVGGKKMTSAITRGGNINPIKGKPETYGLVQNPDTKEITKNPAYKGLSDDEAYKKSLDDMGTARGSGGRKKNKGEMIESMVERGIATKSTDSEIEDNSLQEQIDKLEASADPKIKAIDKLKDKVNKNPENAKAKKKIVDKAIKQYKKDNPKPTTGKKSKEVRAWDDKLNDFELKQWLKFKEGG